MTVSDRAEVISGEGRALEAALDYETRGWAVIPIPWKSKAPSIKGWPKLHLTPEEIKEHFKAGNSNLGILLGEPSAGLIDIDLDAPEAVFLAPVILPDSGMIFGRVNKRNSHYIYVADPIPRTEQFKDIDGTMIVELRSTGAQTVFPPSMHPDDEPVTFDEDGEPTEIDGEELREDVSRLASIVLVARHWPDKGSRQDAALALAGGLMRNGWDDKAVSVFLGAVALAASDEEFKKRVEAAEYTRRRLDGEKTAKGWPALAALLGDRVVNRILEWLHMDVLSKQIDDILAAAEQKKVGGLISAAELAEKDIPDIDYIWGDLLRPKARLAIIGKPKSMKSFLTIQLGLQLATGTPFLGMETRKSNVLYVNFEISEEKFQQRLQDISSTLQIQPPSNFLVANIRGLALESKEGKERLEAYVLQAKRKLGSLDVLIIDPRRNAMGGDENQSEIMTRWCNTIDELRDAHDLGVVIVHHEGKSTSGAGRGSSVFDAWLDTMIWLDPTKTKTGVKSRTKIQARDTDKTEIMMEFDFPVWRLSEDQEAEDLTSVGRAQEFVLATLKSADGNNLARRDLRLEALQASHSEYAFGRALSNLQNEGKIVVEKDSTKQGNCKLVSLISPG